MKKISLTLALTVFLLQPILVSAEETCVELNAPVTDVADFDANGVVNRKDIRILTKYIRHLRIHKRLASLQNRGSKRVNSKYFRKHLNHEVPFSPLYDRNNDGKINHRDVREVARDMGERSTEEDQKLATINNEILAGTYTCVEESAPIVEQSAPIVEEPAPIVEEPAPVEVIYYL